MNTTHSPVADIQNAEQALRAVLDGGLREEVSDAANSLERILIHLTNMQSAIVVTPTSHANVAKRLKDFSVTAARMASKHPKSSDKLNQLSEALRVAGVQVSQTATQSQDARADAA